MTFDDYQDAARQTAVYPPQHAVVYPALGLAGEAGEVAGKVSKVLRDHGDSITGDMRAALLGEIGDCLWFLAALAGDLGAPLSEVAAGNLEKLASRRARGVLSGSGDQR